MMNTDIFYISTFLERLMSVCVISIYSKSSGNKFRSIQILPLLGGLFGAKKLKESLMCLSLKIEKAHPLIICSKTQRLPNFLYHSPTSTSRTYPTFPEKKHISLLILPIFNPHEFAFEGSSFVSNVLSI